MVNPAFDGWQVPEILLVEDNEGEAFLLREGLEHAKLSAKLHHVHNGEECLLFLRKEGAYAQVPTPDLILLNIHMPVMDGREVMAALAADESLRCLPVVVLTSSIDEREVLGMYQLRCSTCIVKPLDFPAFQRLLEILGRYWFGAAALPTRRRLGQKKGPCGPERGRGAD